MRSNVAEFPLEPGIGVRLKDQALAYIQLTKPRIVLLFTLTGFSAIAVEGSMFAEPWKLVAVLLGILLTAGSANAFNQYWDRDIDYVMERTRRKRPLPAGRLSARAALWFATVTGVLATWILYAAGTALAAALGVATIAFYVGIYTMWLKRLTPYNIVIGGAAGATAPLIGWAAATGAISLPAFLMFAIVFMWTPPHFWALALCVKDEYAVASVPMLPVVVGEEKTRRQILAYAATLLPISLWLGVTAGFGAIYLGGASLLSGWFVYKNWQLFRQRTHEAAWSSFGRSILYLFALFLLILVQGLSSSARAAEPTPRELEGVGIHERLGAQADLGLTFRDETGAVVTLGSVVDKEKPTLLFLVYYDCPNLCGFFLNGATEGLKKFDWTVGQKFNVVTISIDPSETSELAAQKKANYLKEYGRRAAEVEAGWRFLVNDKAGPFGSTDETLNVRKLATSVGFDYKFDKRQKQYAHSAGMIVLTPQGRVSRYLYGIDFAEKDLRLALTEAGGGKIGNIVDRVLLFCYHYDPVTRKYALYANNLMRVGGGITVLALGGFIAGLWRRNNRRDRGKS